jgi:hypothetical protein
LVDDSAVDVDGVGETDVLATGGDSVVDIDDCAARCLQEEEDVYRGDISYSKECRVMGV